MAIEIQKASIDDAAALTQVGELACQDDIQHTTLINYTGATPEQLDEYMKWRIERLKIRMAKPDNHYFKAVNTETGEVAGVTCVLEPFTETQVNPMEAPAYPSMVKKEVIEAFSARLDKVRAEILGGRKDYWYVASMAVHPRYQRQGIGKALLKADTDLADAAGQDTYLESRPDAVRLYLSAGFEQVGKFPEISGEGFSPCMLRKAKPVV